MRHLVGSSSCFHIPQSVFAFIIREHGVSLFPPLKVRSRSKHQKCWSCFSSVQPGRVSLIRSTHAVVDQRNLYWSMTFCQVKPYTLVPEAFYNAECFSKNLVKCCWVGIVFFLRSTWIQGLSFGYQTELHSKDTLLIKPDKWAKMSYYHGLSPSQIPKHSHMKIIFAKKKDKGYKRLCKPCSKETPSL